MNVQHSSRSDRWFTPLDVLERARSVLGPIDLDPASEPLANERVMASSFYTEEDDGLTKPWWGTVFCNPPGGKKGNRSMTGLFWERLMHYYQLGAVEHAIFLCFSLEALQSTQGKGVPSIGEFPFCVPGRRIKFDYPAGNGSMAPSHSNAIVYVGSDHLTKRAFKRQFESLGLVIGVGE